MINEKMPYIYYGGDYNPDQWSEEIWKEDMRLFKLAGINIVTLPVFSWAKLQPSEDTYDFEWLDRIMDMLNENGIHVCLATSTAAQPAWMSLKYPEILPVDAEGRKRKHGERVNFCPNSRVFRKFSTQLAGRLAERYKNHPALAVWHIGNEYGTYCYCDNCGKEFREWLKKRYGTIEELNKRWNMSFWGHTVYSWEEIVPPSYLNEMGKSLYQGYDRDYTCFQGISLDYNRFMSESSLECYIGEYNAIKKHTPHIKITTNLMGTFKLLDYFKWAEYMDVVSWDSYPGINTHPSSTAFRNDLMRGLKGGKPFMLMEQTPSQQNWQPFNSLKRPGVMRLQSYQALAHGADTVMFFQLRRSIGACEKYHGALISHAGHENTRVFRECQQLGQELAMLKDKTIDSVIKSRAAIIFDWDNWWAVEFSSDPSILLRYVQQVEKYYRAFYNSNIGVDIISPDMNMSGYDIVVAPVLYMIKPGVSEKIKNFVSCGGALVTTFFSGIVNENDLVTLGGYPGELRDLLGIWVEEIDALTPEMKNIIRMIDPIEELDGEYECGLLCDLINLEGAKALGVYGSDFYKGRPALTANNYGKGQAYYIATDPQQEFLDKLISSICSTKNIAPILKVPSGIEVTRRVKGSKEFIFVLNHNEEGKPLELSEKYVDILTGRTLTGKAFIDKKDVLILEKQ